MIEILDFLKSVIGAALAVWGLSMMVGAGVRLGWDWAGLHTKKAPNNQYLFVKDVKPDE